MNTVFELAIVGNPRFTVGKKLICFLIKLVGLLPRSAIRVRKKTEAQ